MRLTDLPLLTLTTSVVGFTNSVLDTEPTARCRDLIWINKFKMNFKFPPL